VFTALAKKSEERFASIHAFAIALEQASHNTSTELPLQQPSAEALPLIHPTIMPSNQTTPIRSEERITPTFSASPPATFTPPSQLIALSSPVMQIGQPMRSLTSIPQPSSPSLNIVPQLGPEPAMRGISRRALIIGATGIVTAGIAGAGVFWFTRTSTLQGTLFVKYSGHSNSVYSLAWSFDGKRIASGSLDHTVQVWNASDGDQPFTYAGHSGEVFSLAWSPNGNRIASGSGSLDNTVQIWQAV
jgi:eukaryotic-like serine/threonine-protein kinase